MLINVREIYKIPYMELLKNNPERVYLDKVVDLNNATWPNKIMKFFNKKYGSLRAASHINEKQRIFIESFS